MKCCDKYASIFSRHARFREPQWMVASRYVLQTVSASMFRFSFCRSSLLHSETSSLKLSMLTCFCFEMSLSEALLYFIDRDCGFNLNWNSQVMLANTCEWLFSSRFHFLHVARTWEALSLALFFDTSVEGCSSFEQCESSLVEVWNTASLYDIFV